MGSKKNYIILMFFLLTLLSGTVGYHLIEHMRILDAFYMTVITLTTVGSREVGGTLTDGGKIFTILLLFTGLGVVASALAQLSAWFFRWEVNSILGRFRMNKDIENLKDHYIIAGFGRTGQVVASQLLEKKIPFVVIDENEKIFDQIQENPILVIRGDATEEEVLNRAGITKAKGFVATVSSDAANSFAIMTARGLNPHLNIIARAIDSRSVRKLTLAGANKVVAPYILGGIRLAQAITHPHAADLIDVIEDVKEKHIEMVDVLLTESSKFVGARLRDCIKPDHGVMIIGIKKLNGSFLFQPKADSIFEANDHLVIMGPSQNIEKFYKVV